MSKHEQHRHEEQWKQAQAQWKQDTQQRRTTQTDGMLTRIQGYPWYSLVEEGILSHSDDDHLREQAHHLLILLYQQSSYKQCLLQLLRAEPLVVAELIRELPEFQSVGHPSVDALLAFKDHLHIPDHDWPYVMGVFNLGPECSLYSIRRRRQEVNATIPVEPTPGGRGSQFPLIPFLRWAIEGNEKCMESLRKVPNRAMTVN